MARYDALKSSGFVCYAPQPCRDASGLTCQRSLVRVQYRPPLPPSLGLHRERRMKVSIFFDGGNFYRSLLRFDESLRVDYDRLALWITHAVGGSTRSEEHTSELQSLAYLVCRLLLEKKK